MASIIVIVINRGSAEDEMHRLELRLHFCDGLHIEPFEHSRLRSFVIFTRLFETQREALLHDFHKASLTGLRHVFRHVLDHGILGQRRLKVAIRQHSKDDDRNEVVQEVTIARKP